MAHSSLDQKCSQIQNTNTNTNNNNKLERQLRHLGLDEKQIGQLVQQHPVPKAARQIVALLESVGLADELAEAPLNEQMLMKKTMKNAQNQPISAHIHMQHSSANANSVGKLLYFLATNLPTTNSFIEEYRPKIADYIIRGEIHNQAQVDGAIKYIKKATTFEQEKFDEACGRGIVVTQEKIRQAIDTIIEENKQQLIQNRYNLAPKLFGQLSLRLKWADGAMLKRDYDNAIEALIGVRTDQDVTKIPKNISGTHTVAKDATNTLPVSDLGAQEDYSFLDNGRDILWARNTPELIEANRKATGGKMLTRFPPEPNGFLHIGHAKAMNFNFGVAKRNGGQTIMRFDDTNPEAEKQIYIDNIIENLKWLGHTPCKITFSSDYFQELYDLAVKLVKNGKAYVDHQTAAEIKQYRAERKPSPWRDRPIEENLRAFNDMRLGKFDEGTATLRLRGDLNSPNPQINGDIVAYRIKFVPHPHIGEKWCIYPSYDYTHCIIDSLENITHSLCTLEFEVRRESYFWLLHELGLYKPRVWEYSRLNIENSVMSKRRLLKLVNDGYVRGWDDPRMMTINGLRRRGYTPESINEFCNLVGVTRNANVVSMTLLEHCARQHLDKISLRRMVVSQPVRVVLTNWPAGRVDSIIIANHPKNELLGTYSVSLSGIVYIESTDVRLEDSDDYFGLAPKKWVHLKHAFDIYAHQIVTDATGLIVEVHATVDFENLQKPKGNLHWVSQPRTGLQPLRVELRLYDHLFKSKNPNELDDWLSDLNDNSLKIVEGAMADPILGNACVGDRFQFERNAYFVVDPDSRADLLVFNRTVTLRESKDKLATAASSFKKKQIESKQLN